MTETNFIIYIIGCTVSIVSFISYFLNEYKELKVSDLIFTLIISIFSWIPSLIVILAIYGNKVIYKKEND